MGLCMGFSIVTVFEVLHYVCQSLCGKCRRCLHCKNTLRNGGETLEVVSTRQPNPANGSNTLTNTTTSTTTTKTTPGTDVRMVGSNCIRSADSTNKSNANNSSCCCIPPAAVTTGNMNQQFFFEYLVDNLSAQIDFASAKTNF